MEEKVCLLWRFGEDNVLEFFHLCYLKNKQAKEKTRKKETNPHRQKRRIDPKACERTDIRVKSIVLPDMAAV